MPGLSSIVFGRHRKPKVTTGDDPLGSGGLTNNQYRQLNPDPSARPYNSNSYQDSNYWPVSMSPIAPSTSPAATPVSAPSGFGSIGSFGPPPQTQGSTLSDSNYRIPSLPMPKSTAPNEGVGDTPDTSGLGLPHPDLSVFAPAPVQAPAGSSSNTGMAAIGTNPAPATKNTPTPYSPVFGSPNQFYDENGVPTYSKSADENNQSGYWGNAAYSEPSASDTASDGGTRRLIDWANQNFMRG